MTASGQLLPVVAGSNRPEASCHEGPIQSVSGWLSHLAQSHDVIARSPLGMAKGVAYVLDWIVWSMSGLGVVPFEIRFN